MRGRMQWLRLLAATISSRPTADASVRNGCAKRAHTMNPQELGRWGETLARKFLEEKGYRILEAPYRSPLGELDLVAEKGGCLVFVEVKTRTSGDFAPAELAVNGHKQRKMIQSALFYLKTRRAEDRPARFDVVAIEAGVPRLIENAFEARA